MLNGGLRAALERLSSWTRPGNVPVPAADGEEAERARRLPENHPALVGCAGGRAKNAYSLLATRETGRRPPFRGDASRAAVAGGRAPTHLAGVLGFYDNHVFCGRWSGDGSVFASACQDQCIRLYSREAVCRRGGGDAAVFRERRPFATVEARDVGWSIIDVDFSSDAKFLIYSTWSNLVHLVGVRDTRFHLGLEFSSTAHHFCLFSVKFSTDGREIVGGGSDAHMYLYDIERQKRTACFPAHSDDVNSVCFVDESCNVLLSGSDDRLVRIWDRRLMPQAGASTTTTSRDGRAGAAGAALVGALPGHTEGITHVNTRNDGRYVISNSKDQSVKLWDLRQAAEPGARAAPSTHAGDYRWDPVLQSVGRSGPTPRSADASAGKDISLLTCRGHTVLQTLVRVYFSPSNFTGQEYIFTGSLDGSVYFYDVRTGKLAHRLKGHMGVVRDAAWHPHEHVLVTSSWDCTAGVWVPPPDGRRGATDEPDSPLEAPQGDAETQSQGVDEGWGRSEP